MSLTNILTPEAVKSTASAAAVGAAGSAAQTVIVVDHAVYTGLAVFLGFLGVYLARLVTIADENRRLKRVQPWGDTAPLTFIAILIVGPLIWHYEMPLPLASMFGLGVGYAVRVILAIIAGVVTGAARAMAERAAQALGEKDALRDTPLARDDEPDETDAPRLLGELGTAPATPSPPARLPPPDEKE